MKYFITTICFFATTAILASFLIWLVFQYKREIKYYNKEIQYLNEQIAILKALNQEKEDLLKEQNNFCENNEGKG